MVTNPEAGSRKSSGRISWRIFVKLRWVQGTCGLPEGFNGHRITLDGRSGGILMDSFRIPDRLRLFRTPTATKRPFTYLFIYSFIYWCMRSWRPIKSMKNPAAYAVPIGGIFGVFSRRRRRRRHRKSRPIMQRRKAQPSPYTHPIHTVYTPYTHPTHRVSFISKVNMALWRSDKFDMATPSNCPFRWAVRSGNSNSIPFKSFNISTFQHFSKQFSKHFSAFFRIFSIFHKEICWKFSLNLEKQLN